MTSMNEFDFGSIVHIFIYAMDYENEGGFLKFLKTHHNEL